MVCIYKCVMNIYMVLWVRASIRFCACSCHFNAIGFPYIGLSPLGLRETRWAMEMKLSCWVRERQNASSTRCVWTRSIGTTRPLSEAGIFAGLRWEGHLGAHKTNGFLRKKTVFDGGWVPHKKAPFGSISVDLHCLTGSLRGGHESFTVDHHAGD